jgi:hypothetical protein
MRKRTKIIAISTTTIILAIISIAVFVTAKAETIKVAAAVGDLYVGDHIVIKLYGTPNLPENGRGYVYVNSENLGYFKYAFFKSEDIGETIIYIWK